MVLIDTSALIALMMKEAAWEAVERAIRTERCAIPAPVVLEFSTVAAGRHMQPDEDIDAFLRGLLAGRNVSMVVFGEDHLLNARSAAPIYGKGRGNRAQLNIIDLMVYGIAKRLGAQILCTGRDFAETDALIHPASRLS